jgi:hypothetical protein
MNFALEEAGKVPACGKGRKVELTRTEKRRNNDKKITGWQLKNVPQRESAEFLPGIFNDDQRTVRLRCLMA